MTFSFRFDVLLELRLRERDEAGASVGQANQAVAKIDQEIQQLDEERVALRQETAEASQSSSPEVNRLLASGRYDAQLQIDRHSLLQTRSQLQQEVDRRTQRLRDAQAEVKRLEILRDQARHAVEQEELRLEQLEIDEVASRIHFRTTPSSRSKQS